MFVKVNSLFLQRKATITAAATSAIVATINGSITLMSA